MSTLATLVVSLTADTGKFVSEMDNAAKKSQGLSDRIGKAFSTVGKLAGAAAIGGIAALGAGLAFAVKEAMEAQEVQAQLNAVLESTGGIAGVTADMANELADKYSKITRFGDEAIVSGESLLLTFTNIGENVFPEATKTMLDMSQALGTDLQSSATMLGKALQDPIQGVSALQRVGVNFTDSQKALIATLVETGDLAGAQALILKELQVEFGGSAEAAGQTLAGQLDILKTSLGNVAESVGMALIPALTPLVTAFSDWAINIMPMVQASIESFSNWIGTALVPALQNLLVFLKPVIDFLIANWAPIVAGIVTVIIGLVIPSFIAWATAAWATAVATIAALMPILVPVALIGAAVALLVAAWQNNWFGIRDITATVVAAIQTGIKTFLDLVQAWWNEHGAAIMAAVQAMWDGVLAVFEWFKAQLKILFDAFKLAQEGDWYAFGEKLRELWNNAWEAIKTALSLAWDAIKMIVGNGIQAIKDKFENTDWGQVGKNIIEGVANGITAATHFIVEAAKKAAKAAFDAAKGFLGIDSPSTLFMGLGVNMMRGMAYGIDQGAYLPAYAVMGASGQTVQTTNNVNYQLSVYTNSRSERIVDDFNSMKAWARS